MTHVYFIENRCLFNTSKYDILILRVFLNISNSIFLFCRRNCTVRQCGLIRPILVQCSIITLTFIGLRKHLVIGQLNDDQIFSAMKHLVKGQLHDDQFFSAFHWSTSDTPLPSQCITVQCPISKTLYGPCTAEIAGSSP